MRILKQGYRLRWMTQLQHQQQAADQRMNRALLGAAGIGLFSLGLVLLPLKIQGGPCYRPSSVYSAVDCCCCHLKDFVRAQVVIGDSDKAIQNVDRHLMA